MARRSRIEKYPDTQTFHYHNENHKNRLTTDCVARAIAKATNLGYVETLKKSIEFQISTGYDVASSEGLNKFLQSLGWKKMKQPRKVNNSKYTGEDFCLGIQKGEFPNTPMVANLGGHHTVAIVEGKVWDIWNSTYKCVGNYWIKGGN